MNEEISKFIVIIRPEFMCFCKDACRAASFNHLLFRIAGKCKDQPKEKIQEGKILWYANNEQITEEMSNAWGVCKVRQEINDLVTMGLIGRTKDPNWGVNRTKHFFFGTKQCETFLHLCQENNICFVHLDLPDEVKHLIYSSNANDKSIKCICGIHQMQAIDISDANDKSIEAITKIDYKEIHKEDNKEEREVAHATARSRFSLTEAIFFLRKHGYTIEPLAQRNDTFSFQFPSGHNVIISSENLIAEANAVALGEWTDATARSQTSSQNDLSEDDEDTVEREAVKASTPVQEVTQANTNIVQQPPAPRKPRSNPTIPKRPRPQQQELTDELPAGAHSKPVEPHAEMTWGTRKCLQWFDYWRGGTLIAKYKLQQAAGCAKGLAEQFDEATVIAIRGDMADDPYYIERGGPDICDVANNIHKYLNKKKPKKEPSNEHKVVSQYSPKALYEKNKWKADAMIAAYEAQEAAKQGVQS